MFYCFNMKKLWKTGKIILIFAALVVGVRFLAMQAFFGKPFAEYVKKYSAECGLEENLVYAVIFVESRFDSNAISSKKAKGLMQITDKTGTWGADMLKIESFTEDDLFDPQVNIRIGCWYLNLLTEQYNGEIDTVLAAYNAGSGNVSNWLKNEKYSTDMLTLDEIPYKETKNYVLKVNLVKAIYDFLY